MAAAPQQQGESGGCDLLWILALIGGLAVGTWYAFHEYIVYVVFKIKLAEAMLMDIFTDRLDYNIVLLKTLPPKSVTIGALYQ